MTDELPTRFTMVDVATSDGVADCYLARPAAEGSFPPVLLIIDIVGLRDRIKQMADTIAAQGYVVLAPNIFYRAGRAPLWETPNLADEDQHQAFVDSVRPLIRSLGTERISADADAYLGRLAQEAEGPAGIVGYCLGGRLGWMIAASHPDRVAAVAGFHTGRMVTDADDSAHLLAGDVSAEIYWGHADRDQTNSREDIAALDRAMDAAGLTYTTEVYEGAEHGFTMSDEGAWNPAACARHFDAVSRLFGRVLGSRTPA